MTEALLSLGQVLEVGETTATVREWLAAGATVVEVELSAVRLHLLAAGATVAGASLAAVQGHGHADLVPWSQFDGAVVDLVGDYLVDSATVGWAVGGGGMQATVLGVRVVTEAERDALGAGDGVVIFNSSNGAFKGRAGGVWVGLG